MGNLCTPELRESETDLIVRVLPGGMLSAEPTPLPGTGKGLHTLAALTSSFPKTPQPELLEKAAWGVSLKPLLPQYLCLLQLDGVARVVCQPLIPELSFGRLHRDRSSVLLSLLATLLLPTYQASYPNSS